jgi:hypothetical protein
MNASFYSVFVAITGLVDCDCCVIHIHKKFFPFPEEIFLGSGLIYVSQKNKSYSTSSDS